MRYLFSLVSSLVLVGCQGVFFSNHLIADGQQANQHEAAIRPIWLFSQYCPFDDECPASMRHKITTDVLLFTFRNAVQWDLACKYLNREKGDLHTDHNLQDGIIVGVLVRDCPMFRDSAAPFHVNVVRSAGKSNCLDVVINGGLYHDACPDPGMGFISMFYLPEIDELHQARLCLELSPQEPSD